MLDRKSERDGPGSQKDLANYIEQWLFSEKVFTLEASFVKTHVRLGFSTPKALSLLNHDPVSLRRRLQIFLLGLVRLAVYSDLIVLNELLIIS